MADILEEIVAHKRIEIEQRKRFIQPRQMITLTEQKMQEDGGKVPGGSMKESLMNSETGIIAEFKRKSPSKGWIKQEGKPSIIPLAYQQNGASALSITISHRVFRVSRSFSRRESRKVLRSSRNLPDAQ